MICITFFGYGNKNISSKHKRTLEFTKEKEITKKGDCIILVNCNFNSDYIKRLIKDFNNMEIKIYYQRELLDSIICKLNKKFDDDKEIVIRMSNVITKRTLGIGANKSAYYLNDRLKRMLKQDKRFMIRFIFY